MRTFSQFQKKMIAIKTAVPEATEEIDKIISHVENTKQWYIGLKKQYYTQQYNAAMNYANSLMK